MTRMELYMVLRVDRKDGESRSNGLGLDSFVFEEDIEVILDVLV